MPESPSWRWVLSAFAGVVVVVVIPAVLWAGAIRSNVETLVDAQKTLVASQAEIARSSQQSADTAARALALQGERVAAIEGWRESTNQRLGRIEAGQDRMEGKLDRALEKR